MCLLYLVVKIDCFYGFSPNTLLIAQFHIFCSHAAKIELYCPFILLKTVSSLPSLVPCITKLPRWPSRHCRSKRSATRSTPRWSLSSKISRRSSSQTPHPTLDQTARNDRSHKLEENTPQSVPRCKYVAVFSFLGSECQLVNMFFVPYELEGPCGYSKKWWWCAGCPDLKHPVILIILRTLHLKNGYVCVLHYIFTQYILRLRAQLVLSTVFYRVRWGHTS